MDTQVFKMYEQVWLFKYGTRKGLKHIESPLKYIKLIISEIISKS